MSTNHTPNYSLSQWERTDKVLMDDFNADNAKIDAALKTEADARAAGDAALTAALAGKGNCRVHFATYTGTGTCGEDGPSRYTFPAKPLFVVIGFDNFLFLTFRGMSYAYWFRSGSFYGLDVKWSGNTMEWYAGSTMQQMNDKNTTYTIMGIMAAD